MKFSDLKLSQRTIKSLGEYGYHEPTPVQEKAIPKIIEGKNLVVRSQTGTGKTAAFGVGIIERIIAGKTNKALILTPTRELAMQVCTELRGICQAHQLKVYSVYGGQPIQFQIRDLKKRYEILVATPGRLLDLCARRKVDLLQFNAIVLDEADHMLDLGFKRDVFKILNTLPKEKLMLLFSATIDQNVKSIVSHHMPEAENIAVGEMKIVSSIKEEQIELPHGEKFPKLQEILTKYNGKKILVFSRTKRCVVMLKEKLEKQGFEGIGMLQGDMPQPRRSKVLTRFRENRLSILIATNVASRGLHIDNVDLIVNYDEAEDKETHLHRVGRTGRMGAVGKVITFISNDVPRGRNPNRRRGRRPDRRRPRDNHGRSDNHHKRNRSDHRKSGDNNHRRNNSDSRKPRKGYGPRNDRRNNSDRRGSKDNIRSESKYSSNQERNRNNRKQGSNHGRSGDNNNQGNDRRGSSGGRRTRNNRSHRSGKRNRHRR